MREAAYVTDYTCDDCAKASPERGGRVSCWIVSNTCGGIYRSVHAVHNACGQFFPKEGRHGGKAVERNSKQKGQK